jgi:protein-disulfide isomerase
MVSLLKTPRRIVAAGLLVGALTALVGACGGGDSSAATTAAGARLTPPASGTAGAPGASFDAMAVALAKVDYPSDLADGTALGKKDAKVVIQAYEDFTCPHCLEFTTTTEPAIIDQLVKTGAVRFEFKYLPLRQSSVGIMIAAQCAADQNKFWDYQKLLFIAQAKADAKPQDQYSQAMTDSFGEDGLKQMATTAGLDATTFADCLSNGQPALDRIQSDYAEASKLQINGTPGFVVNGQFLGESYPANVAAWKTLVDGIKK